MEQCDPVAHSPNVNGDHRFPPEEVATGEERVIELREEQLVANTELRDLGELIVRTEVDTMPARLELEALREEVRGRARTGLDKP
jgi:stress response protein YsnF